MFSYSPGSNSDVPYLLDAVHVLSVDIVVIALSLKTDVSSCTSILARCLLSKSAHTPVEWPCPPDCGTALDLKVLTVLGALSKSLLAAAPAADIVGEVLSR